MRVDDNSSVRYEGKGEVHVDCTNHEKMIFDNFLYKHKLKANILSLGKLDSEDYDIHLRNGFLILHDGLGRLLTKTLKTKGNMYLLKLNTIKLYLLVEKNNENVWL